MNIQSSRSSATPAVQVQLNQPGPGPTFHSSTAEAISEDASQPSPADPELREKFRDFVGQTFFGQLMASMRKTVGKSKYFHGGRGEEIFQTQMDQIFVERLSETTAPQIADPMFELMQLPRR